MTIDTLICVHSKDDLHDRLLLEAIGSILTGSLLPTRLVIVYDQCWARTQELVELSIDSYALQTTEYVPVVKSIKQGLAVAKNFGLKFCTSDWVTYCDADDRWMNSKLEIQKAYCERDNIDFCFTQSWDIRPDKALVPNCFQIGYATTHDQIHDKINRENCLCHGSAMIKRLVLDRLGGYDTDRRAIGMEDWMLWQKAFSFGYKFYNIPERLYCYSLGTSVER